MDRREEILNMAAGTELDEKISEAFGAEPEVFWAIANKDNTGFYDVRETKSVAEKQLSESPWLVKAGAQVLPIKKYRQFSQSIAEAYELVDQVYKRGLRKNYVTALCAVMIHDYGKTSLSNEYHANAHQQSRAALLAMIDKEVEQ